MGIFDNILKKKKEAVKGPLNLYDVKTKRDAQKWTNEIIELNKTRIKEDVLSWRLGIRHAENIYSYNRRTLHRAYRDALLDAHLSSMINSRKLKTLSKEFRIIDAEGEEIDSLKPVFNSPWFRQFADCALDSVYWGYSLVNLGDAIEDGFKEAKVVDRDHVKPEWSIVVKNSADITGVDYTEDEYKLWNVPVGDPCSHGLLMSATLYAIIKKNTLGGWGEYAEVFGMPTVVAKTDINDNETKLQLKAMLEGMASRNWGVFDPDTELSFVESSGAGNSTYLDLVNLCDEQMSKVIFGQTMTADNGSSRSQSEVHERTAIDYAKSDMLMVETVVNCELLPRMRELGFAIPEEAKFVYDNKEKLSTADKFDRVIKLKQAGYNVPEEYIEEEFGIEVEAVAPLSLGGDFEGKSVTNQLSKITNLYSQAFHVHNESSHVDDDFRKRISILDEDETEAFLERVWSGQVSLYNLDRNLYAKTVELFSKGVTENIGKKYSERLERSLINNVYKFSSARNFQETLMLNRLLREGGRPVSFNEFKKRAEPVVQAFNKNYARTEYNMAVANTQSATTWAQYEEEANVLPYLQYITANDERVRDDHKELNGIVRRVDDPFWDTYNPANDWGCRCSTRQLRNAVETTINKSSLPDVPKEFAFNAGKRKVIWSGQHPYFKNVPKEFKDFKEANFGLPIPNEFK